MFVMLGIYLAVLICINCKLLFFSFEVTFILLGEVWMSALGMLAVGWSQG